MLYSCWKMFPTSRGREKRRISRVGEPWVISMAPRTPCFTSSMGTSFCYPPFRRS